MKRNIIQVSLYPGDEAGYVAECIHLQVVTQGSTVDETIKNMREALTLHFDGENLDDLGIQAGAPIIVSMEMAPVNA